MGIQTTQKALNVYLSDISPHSQAILEFFIGSTGGSSFKLVTSPTEAQVYITDFDYPGSKEHWQSEHQASAKPCIALSMRDPENPHVEWVAKPITAKALIAAAEKISENLDDEDTSTVTLTSKKTQAPVKPTTSKIPPPLPKLKSGQSPLRQNTMTSTSSVRSRVPVFQQSNKPSIVKEIAKQGNPIAATTEIPTVAKLVTNKSEQEKTTDTIESNQETTKQRLQTRVHPRQERWDLLCGDYKNVAAHTFRDDEQYHYNTENYFQGTLIAGLRLAKQTKQVVQIKYAPHQFYICYDEFLIFSPIAPDTKEYADLCYTKVKPGQVNLHILTSPESTALRQRIHTDIQFTYDLESFIWTSCLLTSRGRMPSTIDFNVDYLLKYWPNFTRIENFPFAMKLAAQWQKKPHKVTHIASEMDIPLRYVAAFVSGISGLSLFETDTSIIQKKSSKKTAKKNGLIARLFGRLTKSEASFK